MEAIAALERDAELMLRVREGDETSFGLLLDRHRAPVVHFLYRMVQNDAVSEELAQEVFLRVYRSRATYEPTAKFTTWLFRIATHLALNWIRDGKKEKGHESLNEELLEGVERQIADRQPSIERELVEQKYFAHRSVREIADLTGWSVASVKVRAFRARAEMKKRLARLAKGKYL